MRRLATTQTRWPPTGISSIRTAPRRTGQCRGALYKQYYQIIHLSHIRQIHEMLLRCYLLHTGTGSRISEVECGCKHSKWKGAYAERHVEALAKPETREAASILGFCTLSRRPRWYLQTSLINILIEKINNTGLISALSTKVVHNRLFL